MKNALKYWPLFALILVAAFAATALDYGVISIGPHAWMHYFMGIFLCQFAMLKLFNPSGFADGFQKYDLLAQQSRAYAYVYPWIELVLGLSYLAFVVPTVTYIVTIIVMLVGLVGVVRALQRGLDVRCACMGTVLDVPLSTVTLSEDIGMGAMALYMLLSASL